MDETFLPPKIRNKTASQQSQRDNDVNKGTDKDSGTDKDVITGISTYAQAAKVSSNIQFYKPGTTYIGKRVNFNKPSTKQPQSNFPKQSSTFQSNTNIRPPLLNNPPIQRNDRAPVPQATSQSNKRQLHKPKWVTRKSLPKQWI